MFRLVNTFVPSVNALSSIRGFATAGAEHHRLPKGYNKPSPFALFYKEQFDRSKLAKTEAVRIGQLWNNATAAEKKKYSEMSERIGSQRLAEFHKFSPQEQDKMLEEAKERLKNLRSKRLLRELRQKA